MGKYFYPDRNKSSYVWFKILDKHGSVIKDYGMAGCFGSINYGMDTKTRSIHIYRQKTLTPYNVPEIKRWIADLNEMGFPCEFAYNEDAIGDDVKQETWNKTTIVKALQSFALALRRHGGPAPVDPTQFYNFYVHLKDYVNKSHVFSTLSLIRCLYEGQMAYIPEMYFEKLDANPKLDKFQLLQDCHKGAYNGWSHAVTHVDNGANVKHETLMKRFKKQTDFYTGSLAIHHAWRGD